MIKWKKLIDSVHKSLIHNKVNIFDATVGDFEFGGLRPTRDIIVGASKKSGAIEIIDARGLSHNSFITTDRIKGNVKWLDFVGWVEHHCLTNDILPSEVKVDHLEIRPANLSDLRIYVDRTFKTISITDSECRINGSKLSNHIS